MKRLLTALFVVTVGSGIGALFPPPWGWMCFAGSVLTGVSILFRKKRDVILRFGPLTWTREELCRHFLITGDTGSGKTTSGFHPILVQLMSNVPGWGGLVLGVKGDEHRFVTELAKAHDREHDLVHLQIRPEECSTKWKPPHRYNLLSDRSLSWSTHAKIIVDIAASLTEGKSSAFFRPMAQLALANAFELLDELGYPVSITHAYELLTSQDLASACLKALQRKPGNSRRQQLVRFFESNFTRAQAYEQREAVEGTITTYLGFLLHPDIAAVFSSDEPNTFSLSDYDRGAIVSLTMPQSLATERRYINTYMKILFYLHALRRFDLSPDERRRKNLLLLVADEFQDIVTASEDGFSDHKTVDRVRDAGCCIIAGMQSEVSADPAIDGKKREVLALNMRNRMIFTAADIRGASLGADFIGKRQVWKRSVSSGGLNRTVTRRKEAEHYVRPEKLSRLRKHTAVVVHPSKRFVKMLIPPVDGRGKVYPWF